MSVKIVSGPEWLPLQVQEGKAKADRKSAFEKQIKKYDNLVHFGTYEEKTDHHLILFLEWFVHVHDSVWEQFQEQFNYCLNNGVLTYDNLINLVIMVKNAGEDFRNVLTENLPYIDYWTILDTGSTDGTIDVIREVLKDKPGELFQEPFINFRDSRNRLLDLAKDHCVFNIMLDDSYILSGKLREFLTFARGDDIVDSYSLILEDIDTMYTSNRITKSSRKLRYINIIHEIIQIDNNLNASVPYEYGHITDKSSPYMQERTSARKLNDIKLLEQMYKDDPSDPRALYYLGDSYIGLKEWEKALNYFEKRVKQGGGFNSEIQDSLYYIAVISHMYSEGTFTWEQCHKKYLDCYNFNPMRTESLYFIGKHYLDEGNIALGRMYLKQAFNVGIPEITMSVRKNIYQYHIPKELLIHCYTNNEFELGEKCCRRILEYREDNYATNWLNIFYHINQVKSVPKIMNGEKKVICFVSPGGWKQWDGETLETMGLGGSETFSIRYAETLVREYGYKINVFCDCEKIKDYNGVTYIPLKEYLNYLATMTIDICIINRFPEYVPVTVLNGVEKVYLVLHDLASEDVIIPLHPNLKGVLCISEWHRQQFVNLFPALENKTEVISYGIETSVFSGDYIRENYSFIYPSFPNRGLLPLLQMFPKIVEKYPTAHLNIFCDMKNEWLNKYHKEVVDKIEILLEEQKESVTNHGWVNGETLRIYWSKAHVWFYPCTFAETCCLTAYEAASSHTLVVSNHLAALEQSVGDRGIVITGDPMEEGWKILALNRLFNVLDGIEDSDHIERNYSWAENKCFSNVVSDFVMKYIE